MIKTGFSLIVIGLCIVAISFATSMSRICLYKYEFMFPQDKTVIFPKPSLMKVYTIRNYMYKCPIDTRELSSLKKSTTILKDTKNTKENEEILINIKNRLEKESKTWSN